MSETNLPKILLVEDDLRLKDTIKKILAINDFDVTTASDGEEAQKLILEETFDIVISDVSMPKVGGIELLQFVRETQNDVLTPFILLTAKVEREDIRIGMNKGANDYITKPFRSEELLVAIKSKLLESKKRKLLQVTPMSESQFIDGFQHKIHEFNTPLTSILGGCDLLINYSSQMQSAEIAEFALHMQLAGKRLADNINKNMYLLEYYQYITDKKKINHYREFIDVPSRISIICKGLANRYKRIDDLELDCSSGFIHISLKDFNFIIEQVLDNAFKFSEAGKKVQVKCFATDSLVTIEVKDQGRGSDLLRIEHLAPFKQFDRDYFEQQGLGLGLFITKFLVEQHNGNLELESENSVGTTIKVNFTLPKQ